MHQILFSAPEALVKWITALTNPTVLACIVAVVIHEVHCISKW